MSFPALPNTTFPTLTVLGSALPDGLDSASIDAGVIAEKWFTAFTESISSKPNPSSLLELFIPKDTGAQIWWRDMLALTWDFRTFVGHHAIHRFATDRLASSVGKDEVGLKDLQLVLAPSEVALGPPMFMRGPPDVAWIHLFFSFKTSSGVGSGIARLFPIGATDAIALGDPNNWKAHTVYTNLEGLIDHPEAIGPRRDPTPTHGLWQGMRHREVECEGDGGKPTVLIIGAGQSGLGLAARLKALGLKSLLIEQNERIGDNWRNRYEALCLHDPVWYDHMPYLPFPPNWPVYSPSVKLANWLEHYADIMELNVWLSSKVTSVTQDSESGKWDVTILRKVQTPDGLVEQTRQFTGIHHLVMATGLGSGVPEVPSVPGMESFKNNGGTILHSVEHKRAADHRGKKVVVVGACTSAHDIAADYCTNGVDVTMFQRSSTYIMSVENGWKVLFDGLYDETAPSADISDRMVASFPHWSLIHLTQMQVAHIAQMDKDLLDGLHKVGFRTNTGYMGTGFSLLAWGRAGGYYLDTGASRLISEGKIKLKNDSQIKEFTERGLRFDDGSELEADVVLFATGFGDASKRIGRLVGDEIASKCTGLWGFNEEGELLGAWRDLGIKRFWYMIGNLALCPFHSKHIALQIKAVEEGLFNGSRYAA